MSIRSDPYQESQRIIDEGKARQLTLRLLGGLAIRIHSPSAEHRSLARPYPDLDFVLGEKRSDRAESLLTQLGYEPDKTFNLLNGDHRLLFYDAGSNRQVDIFLGQFRMCHALPVLERMTLESTTLPLAELILTKLQIVQMNKKDVQDICALLLDHPLGDSDDETINLARITELVADDWGLWRTVTLSLDKVWDTSRTFDMEQGAKQTIRGRADELRQALGAAPKSLRWKLRARVGERVPWYDLPEEVKRA